MGNWKQISAQETMNKMETGDPIIIDIRDPLSYEGSHIPGAITLNDSNVEEFISSTDKSRPVIVYCYHGISSQGAADYLANKGFDEVYSMAGGFDSWVHFYPCEP